DLPRRRHRPAAVGHGRPPLPVGHDPPTAGRDRLRLAAARDLRADGRGGAVGGPGLEPGGRARRRLRRGRRGHLRGPRCVGRAAAGRCGRAPGGRGAPPGQGGGDDRPRRRRRGGGGPCARVPARARPGGPGPGVRGAGGRRGLGRRPCRPRPRAHPRRSRLPRFGERRHAAGSLVPGAARPGERAHQRAEPVAAGPVALRGAGAPAADRDAVGALRLDRRRLRRDPGLVLGGVRHHHDRIVNRHHRGPAGTGLLGGDGRHRPPLPGDPDRLWHRPGGPARPLRL
ncbi:MAG: hypothetical protein AVDCRST_MAG76-3587, partial [uncultured Acidimicrobiales bacterium]